MYRELAPAPALAPFVACFWVAHHVDAVRVVPDGCVDILVDPVAARATVAGAMTRAVVVPGGGRRWVAVRFRPGGASAWFATPLCAFADEDAPLEAFWPDAGRLVDAVAGAIGEDAAVRALEASLLARRPTLRDPRVTRAIDGLWRGRRVAEVADDVGWSRQHLTRRVSEDVGYGPALLRRVGRLARVLEAVRGPTDPCWSDLAYVHGYADPAHLSSDFRALVGVSPTRFAT